MYEPGDVPIETDNVARLPPVISRPIARERALPDDNASFSSSSLCVASLNLQLFSIVSRASSCSFIREAVLGLELSATGCYRNADSGFSAFLLERVFIDVRICRVMEIWNVSGFIGTLL